MLHTDVGQVAARIPKTAVPPKRSLVCFFQGVPKAQKTVCSERAETRLLTAANIGKNHILLLLGFSDVHTMFFDLVQK